MSDDETAVEDEGTPADAESGSAKSAPTKAEKAEAGKGKSEKAKAKAKSDSPGIFGRFVNFIREIVAELRKVIWPTRSELLTYTSVLVVFVTIMFTIIGFLDYGFAKGVLWVFGHEAE